MDVPVGAELCGAVAVETDGADVDMLKFGFEVVGSVNNKHIKKHQQLTEKTFSDLHRHTQTFSICCCCCLFHSYLKNHLTQVETHHL